MKALIVGVGAVGGHLAMHLAVRGLDLILCDPDRVEPHNVGAQPLFGARDVGALKVGAARRALRRMAPRARIGILALDVRALGVGVALAVDLVAACVDNRPAELHVARLATLAGKPYLRLATDAATRVADVLVAPVVTDEAPCGACHFTEADLAIVDARVTCGETPGEQTGHVAPEQGALSGALGAEIVAHEEMAPARLVRISCGRTPGVSVTRLLANASCRAGGVVFPHAPGGYVPAGGRAAVDAPRLVALASHILGASPEELAADLDSPLCAARACARCGGARGAGFVRPGAEPCPVCGATEIRPLVPSASRVPASALLALGPSPLAGLDAPVGAGFRFSTGSRHCEVRVRG